MVSQFKNQVPDDFTLEAAKSWIDEQNAGVRTFSSNQPLSYESLKHNAEERLETEILEAVTSSRFSRIDLGKIARWNGVSIDDVEQAAQTICKKRLNTDLEEAEFIGMVSQVRALESVADAGLREWKLAKLARRYRVSRRELMEAYNKALIHQAPIAPLTLSQLKESASNSASWTVQGWFPAGVTILLHGHGGAAKTLFLYEVATAIAKGEAWNGYPTQQSEVLILQSDEPPHITSERLENLGVTDSDPLTVFPGWQVEAMPQLEAYLRSRHEAGHPVGFILIDSNTSINRNTLISENDVEYARPVLQLADLASRYGATIAIVHHSNANGDSRGTKAIHNSVSEVWAFSILNEQTGERLLRVQKNRLGRTGRYKFDFDPNGYRFTFTGEESDANGVAATNEKRIELWLNEESQRGKAYATEEIAHYLNISTDPTRRALSELWSKGIILRKRKMQGRGGGYLYHAGELLSDVKLDRLQNTDRVSDRVCDVDGVKDSAELRNSIGKNAKNLHFENEEVSDLGDRVPEFGCNADGIKESKLDRQLDREPLIDTELDRRSSSPHVPEVGDYVIANGSSVWHRSGSDNLPWQKVDRKWRDKSSLPISVVDEDLFFELIDRSKVLAIKGDRVRVRNQQTGRTSVFRLSDVSVLEKANHAQ